VLSSLSMACSPNHLDHQECGPTDTASINIYMYDNSQSFQVWSPNGVDHSLCSCKVLDCPRQACLFGAHTFQLGLSSEANSRLVTSDQQTSITIQLNILNILIHSPHGELEALRAEVRDRLDTHDKEIAALREEIRLLKRKTADVGDDETSQAPTCSKNRCKRPTTQKKNRRVVEAMFGFSLHGQTETQVALNQAVIISLVLPLVLPLVLQLVVLPLVLSLELPQTDHETNVDVDVEHT
jgi:hypothetical protein